MIVFIVSIVFCILSISISFLPGFLFLLAKMLLQLFSYLLIVVSLILVFVFKDQKNKAFCIVGVFILILFSAFGGRLQSYLGDRNEVNKYLKEHFTDGYKILGVHDSNYGVLGADYNYSFDVIVYDSLHTNIVAKYADVGSNMSKYEVVTDYLSNYLPNYFEDYKTRNNLTIGMEKSNGNYVIKYNDTNKNQVEPFVRSAFENTYNINFCFKLDNGKDLQSTVCSWTNDQIYLH